MSDELEVHCGDLTPTEQEPDPAEALMAAIMLRAARFAPRGGRIRFRAVDRREDGDHVVRSAEVGTEDARRIVGLE